MDRQICCRCKFNDFVGKLLFLWFAWFLSKTQCFLIQKILKPTIFCLSQQYDQPLTHLPQDEISFRVKNAINYHQLGRTVDALIEYELIIPHVVDSHLGSRLRNNLGIIYLQESMLDDAKKSFSLAVKANPFNQQAQFNMALYFAQYVAKPYHAWGFCARAIQLNTDDENAAHLMGTILRDIGRVVDAEVYFTMAEGLSTNVELSNAAFDTSVVEDMKIFSLKIGDAVEEVVDCKSLTMTCISKKPLIFLVPNLMNADECLCIRKRAEESSLKTSQSGAFDPGSHRSSQTAWLNNDAVLLRMQGRISALTKIPLTFLKENSEDLQVVKYARGGQFRVHHDASAFHARFMTSLLYLNTLEDIESDTENDDSSSVGQGTLRGQTWFPMADSSSEDSSSLSNIGTMEVNNREERVAAALYSSPGLVIEQDRGPIVASPTAVAPAAEENDDGVVVVVISPIVATTTPIAVVPLTPAVPLTVDTAVAVAEGRYEAHLASKGIDALGGAVIAPKQGSAVIFFNYLPTGAIDPYAVHAGLPVSGECKWIANFWLDLDLPALTTQLLAKE